MSPRQRGRPRRRARRPQRQLPPAARGSARVTRFMQTLWRTCRMRCMTDCRRVPWDPPDERSAVAEGAASQASCMLPDSCLALMLSPSPGRMLLCDAVGHMLLTYVLDAQHKALSGNAGVLDARHKALSGSAAPQGTSWCRASTPDACGTCAAESAVRLPLHTRKPRPRRVQGATRPHLLPHSPTRACTRSAHS